MVSRLVCRAPDVGQGHGRVEPVEDAERQRHVAEQRPQQVAVELLAGGVVRRLLHLQRVPQVDGQVHDEQQRHQIPAGLVLLAFLGVAAPAQAVHDHRRLDHDLHDLGREEGF